MIKLAGSGVAVCSLAAAYSLLADYRRYPSFCKYVLRVEDTAPDRTSVVLGYAGMRLRYECNIVCTPQSTVEIRGYDALDVKYLHASWRLCDLKVGLVRIEYSLECILRSHIKHVAALGMLKLFEHDAKFGFCRHIEDVARQRSLHSHGNPLMGGR